MTTRAVPAAAPRAGLITPALLGLGALLAGLWDLGGPPMWWDEGWTLSVARNLAERNLYGRLEYGQPAGPGLEGAWPLVAAVAQVFRWLGAGVWQGRLVGAACGAVALVALWGLARELGGRRLAAGAAAAALLLAPHPQLHALVQGRQVLGEVPMLALLCAGLLALSRAPRRPAWLLAALPLLALALVMKAQARSFVPLGLACGALAALALRRWRTAACYAAGAATALLPGPLGYAYYSTLGATIPPSDTITGLMDVSGFVPTLFNRTYALGVWLTFGIPTTLGLAHGALLLWRGLRGRGEPAADPDSLALRAALLGVAASWTAWFLLLSVGVPRYLFPPAFVGSIFLAETLGRLAGGRGLAGALRSLTAPLRERGAWGRAGKAWLAVLILALALPLSLLTLTRYYLLYRDDSAQRVAAFFSAETPPETRVETYESELHFLLDRPYHWPPDQTHVELNRRSLLGQQAAVAYDPLAADPDYLVVGEFARGNGLYAPAIESGQFRLVRKVGGYEIYIRVRGG